MKRLSFRSLVVRGFLAIVLVGGLGCPPPPKPAAIGPLAKKQSDEVAVRKLLGLMRERLVLMNDVAGSKWANKRPITDLQREAALLKDMADRGQSLGLDPKETRRFFLAQIEAAKLIQQLRFDRWSVNGQAPVLESVPDLAVLRQQIDQLNQRLLKALAEADPWLSRETGWEDLMHWAATDLVGQGIDDVVRSTALFPLTEKKSDQPPGF